jgi:hypothetical protein
METTFELNRLFAQVAAIKHGKYADYEPVAMQAQIVDPTAYAHFVAYNADNSPILDSKVALPVIGLRSLIPEHVNNSLACLSLLGPRELVKALQYNKDLNQRQRPKEGTGNALQRMVTNYLRDLEADPVKFDRVALSNRKAVRNLYKWFHIKPSARAANILFNRQPPAGSAARIVQNLHRSSLHDQAGLILAAHIPVPIAIGATTKATDPDVLLALIENMTGNQFLHYQSMLAMHAITPALRQAYDEASKRAQTDSRLNVGRVLTAARHASSDERQQALMNNLQEGAIDAQSIRLPGNALILADRSGSMEQAIRVATNVASFLARTVQGNTYLCFFNTMALLYDVTGQELRDIQVLSSRINASGGTSIGRGLQAALTKGLDVDYIVIVTDGAENTRPAFATVYEQYVRLSNRMPTVIQINVLGEDDVLTANCNAAGIPISTYRFGVDLDAYSLRGLPALLVNPRAGLYETVMNTPLKTPKGASHA